MEGGGGGGSRAARMRMLRPFVAAGPAWKCCYAPAVVVVLQGSQRPGGSLTVLIQRVPIQGDYVFQNPLARYGSTLMIVAACHVGSGLVAVSGVAIGMVLHWIKHGVFCLIRVAACGLFIIIKNAVPTMAAAAAGGDRRLGWV